MSSCCDDNCAIDALRERQRGTLRIVLGINALMFLVIVGGALYGGSTALLADSLDNLGDAFTYGLSLYAVTRGATVKAKVALFKGALIFLAACAVAAQIAYKLIVPSVPIFEVMGVFSLLGLAANSLCLYLLWRHRHDDVNMSSVWECSRNDIASNISVFCGGWSSLADQFRLARYLGRNRARMVINTFLASGHHFRNGRAPCGNLTTLPPGQKNPSLHFAVPILRCDSDLNRLLGFLLPRNCSLGEDAVVQKAFFNQLLQNFCTLLSESISEQSDSRCNRLPARADKPQFTWGGFELRHDVYHIA